MTCACPQVLLQVVDIARRAQPSEVLGHAIPRMFNLAFEEIEIG
jgi:hypothetical protein